MHSFSLTITSPISIIFQDEATSVTCRGTEGELTILKDHMPIVTTLKKGTVVVRREGESFEYEVDGGVLEVSKKGVIILV